MTDPRFATITGVMLAGGRGQRMGGADKGLQIYAGRSLAVQVLERLEPQVGRVLISANRNLDDYASFGHIVIEDIVAGYAGPLAGLHAALSTATSELILAVPCDAPKLPHDLALRLLAALDTESAMVSVARVGKQVQPTFCLVRRATLASLHDFLTNGGRKMAAWQESLNARYVDFDDHSDAFANINSPIDLASAA